MDALRGGVHSSKNRNLKPYFVKASQLEQDSISTPQTCWWSRTRHIHTPDLLGIRRRNSSPPSSARQKISSSPPRRTSWQRPWNLSLVQLNVHEPKPPDQPTILKLLPPLTLSFYLTADSLSTMRTLWPSGLWWKIRQWLSYPNLNH